MSYYEIVCIIHPALQAGHLEDTIKQINDKIVSSKKGKVVYQENWGKKKLSYLIQKQKYGTYYIFQCELDGQFINELSSEFEHNTNIIRYLVSKIDEAQLMKEKKNDSLMDNNNKEKLKQEDKNTPAENQKIDKTSSNQNSTEESKLDDKNDTKSNTEDANDNSETTDQKQDDNAETTDQKQDDNAETTDQKKDADDTQSEIK